VAEWRDLDGAVVAITGASSGIGAATARELVSAGARVVVTARREQRLKDLCDELGRDTSVALVGDISERLVKLAVDRFGTLDSLVANAGAGMYGGILDHDDATLAAMVQTNLLGTVWPIRSAVREFRRRSGGDVVIVASVAGFRGDSNEAVYAATKFAQIGLAGSLDREVRTEGIRVTAVCPAGVNTEFALGVGRSVGDPDLDQMLQPADVAAAILTVLRQPRRLRTSAWTIYSMSEGS
jgi:NADP-dependent 3-hydroxy acid dehydrogenase YdfG